MTVINGKTTDEAKMKGTKNYETRNFFITDRSLPQLMLMHSRFV
jgi:hypothetical protein